MPIDRLFRSLAKNHKGRLVGIVLSGTATDGALGLKAIKAAGGLTFAQDETSAKFPGYMPHSAALTGYVDFVMSPAQIAEKLSSLDNPSFRRTLILGSEDAPYPPTASSAHWRKFFRCFAT